MKIDVWYIPRVHAMVVSTEALRDDEFLFIDTSEPVMYFSFSYIADRVYLANRTSMVSVFSLCCGKISSPSPHPDVILPQYPKSTRPIRNLIVSGVGFQENR